MKRIFSLIITLVIVLSTCLFVLPVSADSYGFYFPIIITDTSGVARTNVPILTNVQGSTLVSSNYVNSTATDTNMKLHSTGTVTDTSEPYMMGTTQVPIIIPNLPANGSVEYDLYTGYSPVQTSFPMIFGNSGFLTVNDNAGLEPANNFSIVASGYLNTGAGASENIVSKTGALSVNVDSSVSGTIDATIGAVATMQSFTGIGSGVVGVAGTGWAGQSFTASSAYLDSSLAINVTTFGVMSAATLSLYATSANLPIGSPIATGTFTPVTGWDTVTTNNYLLTNGVTYAVVASMPAGTGGVNYFLWNGAAGTPYWCSSSNSGGSWTTNSTYQLSYRINGIYGVSVAGISSGIHTITCSETTTAGGTLSLQVDAGTPSTITGVGSVPYTANNWIIDQNNVMPYMTSFTETVGGVGVLTFQPNTMITSTTITNLGTTGITNNGTITWGTNSSITISYGTMVSSGSTTFSGSASSGSGFVVPPAAMPANWYGGTYAAGTVTVNNSSPNVVGVGTLWDSNMIGKGFQSADGYQYTVLSVTDSTDLTLTGVYTGATLTGQSYQISNLPNMPLYGVFLGASQGSGIPINTLYFIIMMMVAFGAFFFAVVKTHSVMLSGAVFIGLLAMESGTGVVPGWIPYVMGIAAIGILFLARQIG